MVIFGIEITKREALLSVVGVLILTGLGFFIATSIHDKVWTDNEKYFKALSIDNDADTFDYALETEVGNALSFGRVTANEPVTDKLIKGGYYAIQKDEEHYTMHTRTVSYKCGKKSTCHRTETYWTWDFVDRESKATKTFKFLGKDFDRKKVDFHNYEYTDTVKTSPHVRYVFSTIPKSFTGTLFANISDNTIKDTNFFHNMDIKSVKQSKEKSADHWVIGFWWMWGILITTLVIIFVALDNRYINGKNLEITKNYRGF